MAVRSRRAIDINAVRPSELDALGAAGVSAASIDRLKRFREAGGRFRDRADLELLGLSGRDLDAVLKGATLGTLVPLTPLKNAELTTEPAGLVGYRLIYTARDKTTGAAVAAGDAAILRNGRVTLSYPEDAERSVFELAVKAPDGAYVEAERDGATAMMFKVPEESLTRHKLRIKATPPAAAPAPAPPAPRPPAKIRGRVLSADPGRNVSGLPVVILVATKPSPGAGDFFPVCHAETEDRGYFVTGPVQMPLADYGNLTAAFAQVAGERIDIRLGTDTASGKPILPQRLILFLPAGAVASVAAAAKEDCSCSEIDFLKKKVLDEFNYFTVVRTTEPKIETLAIGDAAEVDLADLLGLDDSKRKELAGLRLPKSTLAAFLDRNPLLDGTAVSKLADLARLNLTRVTIGGKPRRPGRVVLDGNASIDWDEAPTIYQAVGVAHGHLLQFKQEWLSDGYSIGDLLYSLPLAPGQKKQIVVFDWDRKESAANTQQLDYQENLYNSLARDRDVNEVARATLTESLEGESTASTSGWGVGGGVGAAGLIPTGAIPVPVGGLVGAGGGGGDSSSTASQEAARATTASSQQHLTDRTVQAANAVRSQRSTVIQTVAQGERFQVSAEVVANYNHCHALTIQYFEVIRHFEIRTRLASVRECLFVPLRIEPFTRQKALRWRNILAPCLTDRRLVAGFAAMERIEEELATAAPDYYDLIGVPRSSFAEEEIDYVEGELRLELDFRRPSDDDEGKRVAANWAFLDAMLGADFYNQHLSGSTGRDEAFIKYAGPRLAREIVDRLVVRVGKASGGRNVDLPMDGTLMSEFRPGAKLLVSLRLKGPMPAIARKDVDFVEIELQSRGQSALLTQLLQIAQTTLHSVTMRYRTRHLHEHLCQAVHIDENFADSAGKVRIETPLSRQAMRNPRQEDVALHNALLHHLNENLERYHQCIWLRMDPQRRFMLLDGVIVPERGRMRSAASLVENRLIGIVGNCLVLPVAHGYRLDPLLGEHLDLEAHYAAEPPEPVHLSLPTKGVYAEAVMGQCNSCERKEEDRFWRWEESPIPDSPTAINPVQLPSPTATVPNLQPQPFAAPIINLQNAPAAPDPQGFGALVQLLGNANLFRDVTGLTENQKNALASLQEAFKLTESFGSKAVELTKLAASMGPGGEKLEQIRQARAHNLLDEKSARERVEGALDSANENSASGTLRQIRQVGELVKSGDLDPVIGQETIRRLADRVGRREDKLTDAFVDVTDTASGSFDLSQSPSGILQASFKPGTSGAARDEKGALGFLVDGALSLGKEAAGEIFKTLGKERDAGRPLGPQTQKAVREALVKLAEKKLKDEATSLVKGLPVGNALIIGVKLSLAFAEGVGEEFEAVHKVMQRSLDDEVRRARISEDGLDEDAYTALESLRTWQLRNARQLRPIFENGARRMAGKAVELALGTLTSVVSDAFNRLVVDIVKQDELAMLLATTLQNAGPLEPDSPAARRQKMLEGTLKFMASSFIKQMTDSRTKTALDTTLKAAGGTNPVLVDLLAGSIRALIDLETQELRSGLGEAFPEVKQTLVDAAREIKLQFDATGTLQLTPTSGDLVEAKAVGVGAPPSLITLVSSVSANVPTRRMEEARDAVFALHQLSEQRLTAGVLLFQQRVDDRTLPQDLAETDNYNFTLRIMKEFKNAYEALDALVKREGTRVGDPVLGSDAARRQEFIENVLQVSDELPFFRIAGPQSRPIRRRMSAREFVKRDEATEL